MNVDALYLVEEDVGRSQRLAIGYAAGIAVIAALLGVAATVRAAAPAREEEQILDVKLASAPSAPPPPAAPPPPPPAVDKPAPAAPAARKAILAPAAIPSEAPPESDKPQKPAPGPDEYADGKGGVKGGIVGGDPNGVVGGVPGGAGTAPPPAPPPPPAAAAPLMVTEDMTPASPLSTPDPPVPEEARSQGISATVVVRFTITESGAVSDVAIVRGSHPLLDPGILSTVRGWKYKPALTADGRAVSSKKTKTFRFHFKP